MSTTSEFAERYYKQIKEAMPSGTAYKSALTSNQSSVANKIIENINSLTWATNGRPLSLEEKKELIGELAGIIEVKEANNANYLALVNYILAQLQTTQGKK